MTTQYTYKTGDYDNRKVSGLMTRLRNSAVALDDVLTEAMIVAVFQTFEGNANTITALWNETANDKRFNQFRSAVRNMFMDQETNKPWIKVKRIENATSVKVTIKGHSEHENPLTVDGDNIVRYNAIPVTTWRQFIPESSEQTKGLVKVGDTIKRLLAAVKERGSISSNDRILSEQIALAYGEYERRLKLENDKAATSVETMAKVA